METCDLNVNMREVLEKEATGVSHRSSFLAIVYDKQRVFLGSV